jgi:hypothetical protein
MLIDVCSFLIIRVPQLQLDSVELIMAMEEEFVVELPDQAVCP